MSSEGFLQPLAANVVRFAVKLSLARLRDLLPSSKRHVFMDCYVLGWAIFLTLVVFHCRSASFYCEALVCYRVFDIVSYRLYYLLEKSRTSPWTAALSRRSLVIVAINFYEVIVAFGTLYYWSGEVRTSTGLALASPISSIYFSAVTMMTLGYGDFSPSSDRARVLVLIQLSTAMLFLAYLLPGILATFLTPQPQEQEPLSKPER